MSLIEMGFRSMAETITRLQKRNSNLRAHNTKLRASRDEWKAKAIRRRHRVEYLSGELRKCRARTPRRPTIRKRRYTPEEWAAHARVVARILAIPKRDIE